MSVGVHRQVLAVETVQKSVEVPQRQSRQHPCCGAQAGSHGPNDSEYNGEFTIADHREHTVLFGGMLWNSSRKFLCKWLRSAPCDCPRWRFPAARRGDSRCSSAEDRGNNRIQRVELEYVVEKGRDGHREDKNVNSKVDLSYLKAKVRTWTDSIAAKAMASKRTSGKNMAHSI